MKTLLTALTLTLAFLAPAQDNLCASQHLCSNIMEMLAGIDATKYNTYTALFLAKEDVPGLIDQMTLSEEQKDRMKERSSGDNQEEYRQSEFSELLLRTKLMAVKWKDVKLEDFLYCVQRTKGIKELKGNIYFTDGVADYQIRLQAVFFEGEFQLLELEDLRQYSETNFHDINEFIEGDEENERVVQIELVEVDQNFPTKSHVIHALTNLYIALEAGDFELVLSFLIAPSGFTKEEINNELETMLERNEITLEGVQRLQEKATLASVEEHHGERGLLKAERAGLNSEECSALYIEGTNIECMFHWNGEKLRFFRIDNIRADEGN